ncbi:MAG: SRPBCC family protein [Gammaproteobacteria bacterium]|nr:SRPBCC family protein [Gammaproteobacteria bacterium]
MNQYGELLDTNTVRFERLLPGPIERVWEFLIDGDKRARWLCGGETEQKVGGKVEMRFHNASLSSKKDIERPEKYKDMPEVVSFAGTVIEYDPPTLLTHTWDFEDNASEVRYQLRQQGDKVLLTLTHTRLRDSDEVLSVCGGWHTHLDILVDILDGREPKPFWKTHMELEADYERLLKKAS